MLVAREGYSRAMASKKLTLAMSIDKFSSQVFRVLIYDYILTELLDHGLFDKNSVSRPPNLTKI